MCVHIHVHVYVCCFHQLNGYAYYMLHEYTQHVIQDSMYLYIYNVCQGVSLVMATVVQVSVFPGDEVTLGIEAEDEVGEATPTIFRLSQNTKVYRCTLVTLTLTHSHSHAHTHTHTHSHTHTHTHTLTHSLTLTRTLYTKFPPTDTYMYVRKVCVYINNMYTHP